MNNFRQTSLQININDETGEMVIVDSNAIFDRNAS